MDRQTFEAELKRDGYDILTNTTHGVKVNPEHSHPYDVRAMVNKGALTLKTQGPEAALIAAIALGNLPEAISGSAGMQAAGRSVKWILGVWSTVAVGTVVLTGAGFLVAGSLSPSLTAPLELFGAGALIAMVTETIIPEAVHGTPKFAGTITAVGFAALLLFAVLAE